MSNCALSISVEAADPPIQRNPLLDEQQRLRSEEIKRKQKFTPGQDLQYKPEEKQFDDTQCIDIKNIQLSNTTLITDEKKALLISGYEFSCLTAKKINKLLLDITKFYIEGGYITSRPLKPVIDKNTNLVIPIVEGKISEAVQAKGNTINIDTVIPGLYEKIFNIRDLEQGLDQLNRLASNDVTVDLAPGKEFGTSQLVINNTEEKQWNIYFSIDNYTEGSDAGSLTFSYDNLFGLNDSLSLSWRHQLWFARNDSESKSINWSVPYGYWTFSAYASEFEYLTPIDILPSEPNSEGFTREQGIKVDYISFRDQKNKISLGGQFYHKKIRNFFLDSLIGTSSHDLTIAELSINWFRIGWGALWVSELGYSQGLGIIGGDDTDPPDTQFEKWRYSINMIKPILDGWQITSLISGQYSQDDLPGTEDFQIGSPYSVRGFRDQSASAEQGVYWQNTLYTPWKKLFIDEFQWRSYVGLDIGRVAASGDIPGRELSGATIGVNFDWQQTSQLDIQFARSLKKPDNFDQEGWHGLVRFSVNW